MNKAGTEQGVSRWLAGGTTAQASPCKQLEPAAYEGYFAKQFFYFIITTTQRNGTLYTGVYVTPLLVSGVHWMPLTRSGMTFLCFYFNALALLDFVAMANLIARRQRPIGTQTLRFSG